MKKLAFVLVLAAAAALSAPAGAQTQPAQSPDPNSMRRSDLEQEVTVLRQMTQGGAVLPNRPAGCTAAEQRQFDFWLGEWDVSPSSSVRGVVVGESTISMNDQGCVLIENWRPMTGPHGHSLNIYDTPTQKWRQFYADATGRLTIYEGDFRDGVMYLDNTGAPPPNSPAGTRVRMNYQALDANTVRQWGEQLDPATNAWNVTWDLTYRRRPGTLR